MVTAEQRAMELFKLFYRYVGDTPNRLEDARICAYMCAHEIFLSSSDKDYYTLVKRYISLIEEF
jgi:hypothetical protein